MSENTQTEVNVLSDFSPSDNVVTSSRSVVLDKPDRTGHSFVGDVTYKNGDREQVCHDFFNGNLRITFETDGQTHDASFVITSPNRISVLVEEENSKGEKVEVFKDVPHVGTEVKSYELKLPLKRGLRGSDNKDVMFRVRTSEGGILTKFYKFEGRADVYDYSSGNSNRTPTFKLHEMKVL